MNKIVLECKPDEAFVKTLGFSRRNIIHQPNKGAVFNYLKKNPGAIGLVDEDPGSANPNFFRQFLKNNKPKYGIKYYGLSKGETRLIVISPRLEEWVIEQAQSVSLKPQDFGLPSSGKALHKIINSRINAFERMLNQMYENQCKGLLYLKSLVEKHH